MVPVRRRQVPYLINKVFLSSSACGELSMNWARHRSTNSLKDQKLGVPLGPEGNFSL